MLVDRTVTRALLCLVFACGSTAAADLPASWIAFRSNEMGIQLRHPPEVAVVQRGEGKSCVNDVCSKTLSFSLKLSGSMPDKDGVFAQVGVQFGLVKEKASIEQYYRTTMKREIDPQLERVIDINGIRVLRRKGLVEYQSGKMKSDGNGNFVPDPATNTISMRPDDRAWFLVGDTDLVTITNLRPASEFDETFEKILSSISIIAR